MSAAEHDFGYVPCACRDCAEVAILALGEKSAYCAECEAAGCPGYQGVPGMSQECQAPEAYGCDDAVLDLETRRSQMEIRSAIEIVTRAIESAGEAGGIAEIEDIAANGIGAMTFSARDMLVLLEAYGSPGEAMRAIQVEAQRRVSQ